MPNLKHPQINQLIVSGRLTADPEVKLIGQDNTAVCNVTLATDDGWGDKKKPIFVDCTCWKKTAEIMGKLHKSSPVVLEGRITMDKWQDKATGKDRTKLGMTVNRVHGLAWDDEKPEDQGTQDKPPF